MILRMNILQMCDKKSGAYSKISWLTCEKYNLGLSER